MRILLWYWGRRGGGAQFAACLGRALADGPHGVSLSVSRQGELIQSFRAIPAPRQEIDTYTSIAGFAAGFARLRALTRNLIAFAHDQRADVVISAMAHTWTPFVAPAIERSGLMYVPIVHDGAPHPGDWEPFWRWRLARELGAACAAVALSDSVAGEIASHRPGLPILRLPLGALVTLNDQAGADVQLTGKSCDFLFFGRIRAYKGLDLLRDAWARIVTMAPGATLRIVGEGNISGVAPGLDALPGVTLEARWVAESEMPSLIGSAGAVVLPYREASQSGVVPIALALGVPVVATAVGGLSEQVKDDVSGLVVPPLPDALAAGMLRMLDPAEHSRLAAGARDHGIALADWSSHAEALRDGLAQILRPADGGTKLQARPVMLGAAS